MGGGQRLRPGQQQQQQQQQMLALNDDDDDDNIYRAPQGHTTGDMRRHL